MKVDLSLYDNNDYEPGAGLFRRASWYLINALIFDSWMMPSSKVKSFLLRGFGCDIGRNIVIKPRVNIKYPWNLKIGSDTWIGEGVWIDSLAKVTIGENVCISQDAYLLTGNHNYKDPAFGLIVRPIKVEDSAWIGAKSVICPGASIGEGAVVTVGSVVTGTVRPWMIIRGNPAVEIRKRIIDGANDG